MTDDLEWTDEELAFDCDECPRCHRALVYDQIDETRHVACTLPGGCGWQARKVGHAPMEIVVEAAELLSSDWPKR